MPTRGGKHYTVEQIKSTIVYLKLCKRLNASGAVSRRYRVSWLINVAINRRAGIPDVACRKQEDHYQTQQWRDCKAIRNWVNHRIRIYGLETPELRRRYEHLICRHDDV
jgi:hypothetical protein